MNCLAVDDESLALDLLEDNIRKVPFLNLVQRCRNAFEATEVLHRERIDLMFLDIQMPGLTGVQFLQSLGANPPMVIFVTAYEQYALDGFNLDVVDYLLKPVSFERFLKAASKAYELYHLKTEGVPRSETLAGPILAAPSVPGDHLFVNADYALVKIRLAEITYIEGLKDYVKIFLDSATRPVITRMTLKALEEKLPTGRFLRVHKSYIVSLDKIESVRNLRIKIGPVHVPVSEHYSETFFKALGTE